MTKTPSVFFYDTKPYDEDSFRHVNRSFDFGLKFYKGHLTNDTAVLAKGHEAICIFVNDHVDREVVRILVENGVRLIALRCAGYNNIDLQAVYGKIHVVRVPAYSPHAVAEHAVALMLALNRKTHKAYYRTRDNNFTIGGLLGFDMCGKTAGIVGTGKIGRVLSAILRGFGMRVLAFDPHPDMDFANQSGCTYVSLKTLYQESDIISLHCPLSKETEYMIDDESIRCMKTGVMIINTGRGKLINTKALINGLKRGAIGAAGLDVYEEESEYFFEDYSATIISDDVLARLLTFPNVLVTSHQGFFTREALHNIAETTLNNCKDFFAGAFLRHEICYRCDVRPCVHGQGKNCF